MFLVAAAAGGMLMGQGLIMIVDNDRDILGIMRYALESYGYLVIACESADEAQLWAETNPCDVVITDHDMPGVNGLTLVRELRSLLPAAVIIGMSGQDMNIPFLKEGANDFIRKPFVPYDLVMMIDGGDLQP